MPTLLHCPACGHELHVPENVLGKKIRCLNCRTTFRAEEECPFEPVEDAEATEERSRPRGKRGRALADLRTPAYALIAVGGVGAVAATVWALMYLTGHWSPMNWLNDRLAAAQIAAVVLDAAPEERISEELEDRLLKGVGAEAIAVRSGGARRLLARGEKPPMVAKTVDLRDSPWWLRIEDAFEVLVFPADQPIRIVGHGMDVDFVELIIDQRPLRLAAHLLGNFRKFSLAGGECLAGCWQVAW